ncbi:MAG: MgtC/SapB family protein [Defluviitaleaceae bacterium]|nr:MgtC/SapB family protein [Defluviitaleaceae bacterium]
MGIHFLINSLIGILVGIIIGLERQWQQKLAGVRTTALVSFGACLFVMLSVMMGDTSPTRVAAQVVSGVGFLAGGVIIRDGYSVSGINTAATLWCSAAVGAIVGAGFPVEGMAASFILMFANIALRGVSKKVDQVSITRKADTKHYVVSITCLENKEIYVRTVLLNILNQLNIDFNHMTFDEAKDGKTTIITDLEVNESENHTQLKLKSLTEKLLMEKSVLEVNRIGSDTVE